MLSSIVKSDLAEQVGQALRLQKAGNLFGAAVIYEHVLQTDPMHADALHLYGCLLDEQGHTDEAIGYLERAIKSSRKAYPYYYNLANMLAKRNNLNEAIRYYGDAIRLKPDYAQAHNNLGLAFARNGDKKNAKLCFLNAIRCKADYPDPHYNLGLALKDQGDLGAAILHYQNAIRLRPGFDEAYYNLGNALSLTDRLLEAIAAYREAAKLRPDNPKIHTNLGSVLLKLGRIEEAVACFRKAVALDPSDALSRSNLILSASYASSDPALMYAECQQWDKAHGLPLDTVKRPHSNSCDPKRKLRIGYVSADFRAHAAAYWIEPLLAGHSHEAVEIFCYHNNSINDAVTARIKKYVEHWVECFYFTDEELAQRIRSDGIDILIDLSGHTDGHRLLVFARQPAPVQVSWFGFPISTGLQAISYRLTDEIIDPLGGNDRFYSEKLVRLSRFYASYRPDDEMSEVGSLPAERNGYITFLSINNLAKITPQIMELWAKILVDLPNSKLIFQAAGLDTPEVRNAIISFFAERNVKEERLHLRGWSSLKEYFALGHEADIMLDSFPFNGGVTTCHALWMGMPVISLSGRSAASSVGKSILTNIGLPELAADNEDEYVNQALLLARDLGKLKHLRTSLRQHMEAGGILDGQGLAAAAETCFRNMWRSWCNEQK